jgi:hypothetical protein
MREIEGEYSALALHRETISSHRMLLAVVIPEPTSTGETVLVRATSLTATVTQLGVAQLLLAEGYH